MDGSESQRTANLQFAICNLHFSISFLLADVLFHALNDLLESELGAVQNDGIRGGDHGSEIALAIAGVAKFLSDENLIPRDVFASAGHFPLTAVGAFLRLSDQKELASGVGKNDRALVAAFGDHVPTGGNLSL